MKVISTKDEMSLVDSLLASSDLDLPPNARHALSQAADNVVKMHLGASDMELKDYVAREADGRKGASGIFDQVIADLFKKSGNLELLKPQNQELLKESVTELAVDIGRQVVVHAKNRIGVASKVASKEDLKKFVEQDSAKRIQSESIPLSKLTSKLEASQQYLARQECARAVALIDVSALGHNYRSILKSTIPSEDKWGWFQAAECPIDVTDQDVSQTKGFFDASRVVRSHAFTLIYGVENWREEFTEISTFISHWAKKSLSPNDDIRLIVIPFLDTSNKTIETVAATLISEDIPLIYFQTEYESQQIEPIIWDAQFGEYSDSVKQHTKEIARLIYKEVTEVIRPELNDRQVLALDRLDSDQAEQIQDELVHNAGSLSLDAQRLRVKKRILDAILKASTPTYSVKRNPNPLTFYQQHLEPWFKRFGHPVTSLNETAPNLSRTLRERKLYPQSKKRTNRKILRN